MAVSRNWAAPYAGDLVTTALLFGVSMRAPHFAKLPNGSLLPGARQAECEYPCYSHSIKGGIPEIVVGRLCLCGLLGYSYTPKEPRRRGEYPKQ